VRATIHACILLLALARPTWGQSPTTLNQDILPKPLAVALADYARQTGLQLFYVSDLVAGKQSTGAHAGLTARTALDQILQGTGLRYEFLNSRSVRIVIDNAVPVPAPTPKREAAPSPQVHSQTPIALDQIVVSVSPTPAPTFVALSRAVVTTDGIQQFGVKDLVTLARLVPGIEFDSYPDYGAGIETNIAIRGINARDGSTTAIYIDDVSLPGDRLSSFGLAAPLTFDLERVEILRGPQGVLYGEGAEGGVVRFITVQPDLNVFQGYTDTEVSFTQGGSPSYELGAAFGGPVIPGVVGFRASAWSRREGGYVDRVNPFTGATVDANANRANSDALRIAATIAPSANLQLTFSSDYQTVRAHDTSTFYSYLSNPAEGVLQNGKLLAQGDSDSHALDSIKASFDVGAYRVSNVSAYFRRNAAAIFDNTNDSFWFWPNPLGPEFPLSYSDAKPEHLSLSETVWSERLSLSNADPAAFVTWIVGTDYQRAHYTERQDLATSALSDGGEIRGAEAADRSRIDLAIYGDANLHFTGRLTGSIGLRAERGIYDSRQLLAASAVNLPPLSSANPGFNAKGRQTLVAPSVVMNFQSDEHALFYGTLAKGYRDGGPNPQLGVACPIPTPASYGADSLWSFEVGSKISLLDNRVQIDGDVFYMRWLSRQIQIPVPGCGYGYTINAGVARSEGFELALQAALSYRLTAKLTVAFANARYLQTVLEGTQVVAARGDTLGALPLVPSPWSSTPSLEYRIAKKGEVVLSATAWDVFHSSNHGPFTTDNPNAVVFAPDRRADPNTNLLNFSVVATWPRFDLSLFLNNALGSQPVLQYRNRVPTDTLFYATTFRPRTMGLRAQWRLGSK
jgi:iron complex outermembrane receptor protein